MKLLLSLAVAAWLCLHGIPARADTGQISRENLAALGLKGLDIMTDSEGMKVRGKTSVSVSGGFHVTYSTSVGPTDDFFDSDASSDSGGDMISAGAMSGQAGGAAGTSILHSVTITYSVGGLSFASARNR